VAGGLVGRPSERWGVSGGWPRPRGLLALLGLVAGVGGFAKRGPPYVWPSLHPCVRRCVLLGAALFCAGEADKLPTTRSSRRPPVGSRWPGSVQEPKRVWSRQARATVGGRSPPAPEGRGRPAPRVALPPVAHPGVGGPSGFPLLAHEHLIDDVLTSRFRRCMTSDSGAVRCTCKA
jgi:hypothetical protein